LAYFYTLVGYYNVNGFILWGFEPGNPPKFPRRRREREDEDVQFFKLTLRQP